jgi:hypothetical protein
VTSGFAVRAGAGSLRDSVRADVVFPHAWTSEGVAVEMEFTGAHVLHLATAACVLNDLYREADRAEVVLGGVVVSAQGDFDRESWQSTGSKYRVEVASEAGGSAVRELIQLVDDLAEVPRALRHPTAVWRED